MRAEIPVPGEQVLRDRYSSTGFLSSHLTHYLTLTLSLFLTLLQKMRPALKKKKASSSARPPHGSKASSPSAPMTICALVENRAREACIAVIQTSHSSVLQVCLLPVGAMLGRKRQRYNFHLCYVSCLEHDTRGCERNAQRDLSQYSNASEN